MIKYYYILLLYTDANIIDKIWKIVVDTYINNNGFAIIKNRENFINNFNNIVR